MNRLTKEQMWEHRNGIQRALKCDVAELCQGCRAVLLNHVTELLDCFCADRSSRPKDCLGVRDDHGVSSEGDVR